MKQSKTHAEIMLIACKHSEFNPHLSAKKPEQREYFDFLFCPQFAACACDSIMLNLRKKVSHGIFPQKAHWSAGGADRSAVSGFCVRGGCGQCCTAFVSRKIKVFQSGASLC